MSGNLVCSELVRLPNIIVQPTEHVVDVQWSTTSSGPWATMEFQTDGQDVWLMITISNATTVFFEVTSTHSRRPLSNSPSSGFVHQDGDKFVLNNGLISVQLPAQRGVTTDPRHQSCPLMAEAQQPGPGLQATAQSF